MDWNRVSVQTTRQAADMLSSILLDAGAGGVEINDKKTGGSAHIQESDTDMLTVSAYYGESEFEKIYSYIKGCIESLKYTIDVDAGSLETSVEKVMDADWDANFKKHFTTFRAAGNIVVKPTWQHYKAEPGDIVIEMDPGAAFGSGVHETTKMCLELIQKYMPKNASVLDVGCGSGILGSPVQNSAQRTY